MIFINLIETKEKFMNLKIENLNGTIRLKDICYISGEGQNWHLSKILYSKTEYLKIRHNLLKLDYFSARLRKINLEFSLEKLLMTSWALALFWVLSEEKLGANEQWCFLLFSPNFTDLNFVQTLEIKNLFVEFSKFIKIN